MKHIAYMHIAKTAGSSINNYFLKVLGPDKCDFFVEHKINSGVNLQEIFGKSLFVSGHFFTGHLAELPEEKFFRFTVFREPFSHIVSNILWLDHYSQPRFFQEYSVLPPDIKMLVDGIAKTDLTDARSVDHLLVNLSSVGLSQLDNLQTRYLIGDWSNFNPLSLQDCEHAIENLRYLDLVGTTDSISDVVKLVAKSVNLTPSINFLSSEKINQRVSTRNIDVTNPIMRQVLNRRVLVDRYLFSYIKKRIAEQGFFISRK